VIRFNGGPGCSSAEGALVEVGPLTPSSKSRPGQPIVPFAAIRIRGRIMTAVFGSMARLFFMADRDVVLKKVI